MKLNSEIKTGITAIVIIFCSYWGFKFLKNENIFSSNNTYYALFDNVDGLAPGSSITLNGLRIGKVNEIKFDPNIKDKILVSLNIEKTIVLNKNSLAKIYSSSLIGNKSIHIYINNGDPLINYDTIQSKIDIGVLDKITNDFTPIKNKIEKMLTSIDSTSLLINDILEKNIYHIYKSIENIYKITETISSNMNKKLLDSSMKAIHSITKNMDTITKDIKNSNIKNTIIKTDSIFSKLDSIITKINKSKGTLGKLIDNDSIYNNMNASLLMLKELIDDIKINPRRYLHFSIFGRTPIYVKIKDSTKQEK